MRTNQSLTKFTLDCQISTQPALLGMVDVHISQPGKAQATLNKRDQAFIDRMRLIIDTHYADASFGRAELARIMAISQRQLQRKLKSLINENAAALIREFRLNRAKLSLREGWPVNLVSDENGFSSPAHFSRTFKARYGMSPKQFQNS